MQIRNKIFLSYVLSVFSLFPSAFASFEQPQPLPNLFAGTWKNTRGSILTIKPGNNNRFTGTFVTAVAKTKSCIGQKVPVTGFINGKLIAFTTNFLSCGSTALMASTGFLNTDDGTLEIETVITMNAENEWNSRIICRDLFRKKDNGTPQDEKKKLKMTL